MKIRAIVKQIKRELYILYRRFMRTVARFVLGLDNCPKDYRKRYREAVTTILDSFVVVIAGVTAFILMAILFA